MAKVSIAGWAAKIGRSMDETARAVKLDLFTGVIENTRVREGRLKGNWQTSTGTPVKTTIERLDPEGTAAINEAAANVTGDGVDYMTNNLPYAAVWEERDAMIKRNVLRIKTTLDKYRVN